MVTTSRRNLSTQANEGYLRTFLRSDFTADIEAGQKAVVIVVAAEQYAVWVSGIRVPVRSDNKAVVYVFPGTYHVSWRVRGTPGDGWGIEITAPKEAQFKVSESFDESGLSSGFRNFRVN
jgi:hypothetical protein